MSCAHDLLVDLRGTASRRTDAILHARHYAPDFNRETGYGDFLLRQMRRYDFGICMNTPAELASRYVRDNVTAVTPCLCFVLAFGDDNV